MACLKLILKPRFKVLIYATIATMSLFQITLQEIWLMKVWQVWFWKPQGQQSILLSNGIFFFGCFIGTQITKFLQKQSSKFIFLLSDLLNLFANYNFYLLFQQNFGYLSHKNRVDIYLITRSFIGIAVGINYTQALIYVKQISYKTKKGYLFLLIPLQLQIGLTLGNDSPNIMLFCGISTVVRMILLIVIDIETPNYYFFIKQDIRETKRILGQIHWDNVDIQLQIINDFQQRKANQEILSKKYLKKYIRSLALVIITQLSGFQMMINYYPEIYGFQNVLGLPMIILLIIFGRYINKSYQIILAQLIVCLGLFGFQYSLSSSYLIVLGYYLGLGSLNFQLILVQLPEIGIIECINAQWIINLFQMCLLAIFYDKSAKVASSINDYEIIHFFYTGKFVDIAKIYFCLNVLGLIILLFILRVIIYLKKESTKSRNQIRE